MASQSIPPAVPDLFDAKAIAREIRFRLQPKSAYYDFIRQCFFCGDPALINADPFEIEIPQLAPDILYHKRDEVSRTIDRPGSMIILGKPGSGKTMIFNTRKSMEKQLLVRIAMPRIYNLAAFQPASGGIQTPLNPWTLAYLIFNAFWADFFGKPSKQAVLPKIRVDRLWMENLRWFYHHFPPMPLLSAEYLDFEMNAWLQTEPEKERIPDGPICDYILEKLIRFIVLPVASDAGIVLYNQITVWVDGVDTLKGNDQKCFAEDIYHILELQLPCFEIKVLINKSNNDTFPQENKFAYYPNNLSFYELPEWEEHDLRSMLITRLYCLSPAFQPALSDYELPKFENNPIFDEYVREHFFENLIKESRREYQNINQEGLWDAPIHLLRLSRGCLAYANGQWSDGQTRTVLTAEKFQKIIDAYWDI